jgi:phosphotransferase system enzyme I (PtsP)
MPKAKDGVALICDIGELAGLFDRTRNLEDFLRTVVSTVAHHMHAAVCSVYLYDDVSQELILTANQGLKTAEGRVRLKLGEGLVGLSMQELRPIREANALRSPFFRLVSGIDEERYAAFLAVPILRGSNRVGVLVVQDTVEDYFDEHDAKSLQAIAAQLATTIENFHLIIGLRAARESLAPQKPAADEPRFLKGVAASPGWGIGKALFLDREDTESTDVKMPRTAHDFRESVRKTEAQLLRLQRHTEEHFADVASMIFSAHLLILKDTRFTGQMAKLIENGVEPRDAIQSVVRNYVALFSASKNPRLCEKADDVKDLGHRLLRNLTADTEDARDFKGRVVLGSDMLPSDIVKLAAQNAEALVVIGGGVTSHVSILARSLQLPMIVLDEPNLLALPAGRTVLADGGQGNFYIEPGNEVVNLTSSCFVTKGR